MRIQGELYIEPTLPKYNLKNGRFLKGHVPHNKGKKWSDYVGKRAQKRMSKGWKNLETHRGKGFCGKNKKAVIAVSDEGKWLFFPDVGTAGEWSGGSRENVGRCCRFNLARHVNKFNGKVNTDHRYNGVRFYFETDDIWTTKVKQE